MATLLWSTTGFAQELTPRAYWPTPTGARVGTIGYSRVSGDTIPDPSLPLSGVDSNIDTMVLGYRHTLDLWGRTANLILELPYSDGETAVEIRDGRELAQTYQGLGDLSATLSVNLLGAPAMSGAEFADFRSNPQALLGASLKVVAPTGRYDSDRILNVGANRWAAKAELGYILPLGNRWLFEVDAGAWVFGDNDDFLGRNREQKPIFSVQSHLVHRFGRGFWASLDATFYEGGRGKLGDQRLENVQRDSKLGVTVVYPFAPNQLLKLGYSVGSLNDSEETFNVFVASYSRAF
jgi:Putative MetA-pathway of phenol degradation